MATPPTHQTTALHAGNPTTSLTITLPTTAAGDILILVGVNAGSIAALTPGGTFAEAWTAIDSAAMTASWGGTWWARCTGDHNAQTVTLGVTGNPAVDSCSGAIEIIRGAVSTGSPIDSNISAATVTANGLGLAAFTTTRQNTLVVFTSAADDNIAYSLETMNAVAMNERIDASSTGGADSGVMVSTLAQAAAGTTGAFAGTHASALSKRLCAFAIKGEQVLSLTAVAETSAPPSTQWPKATAEWVASGPGVGGATSATPVCPPGTVVGDIILFIYSSIRGVPKHTPALSGGANGTWTTLVDGEDGTTSSAGRGVIYAKLAEAADLGATFTIDGPNVSGALNTVFASMHAIRVGRASTLAQALDASVTYQNVVSPFTVAGFSTAFANELIVLALAKASNVAHDTYVATDPTVLTERLDDGTGTGVDSGNVLATALKATTGATGSFDWNASGDDAAAFIGSFIPIPFIDKTLSLGVITQASSAIAQTFYKALTLTTAAEADSAIAQTLSKTLGLTLAAEADSAIALSLYKAVTLAVATETDTVVALDYELVASDIFVTLTPVTETTTAQVLAAFKALSVTAVGETSTAPAESVQKELAVTTAAESDSAEAVTFYKAVTLTTASETDSAQAVTFTKTIFKDIATVAEADSAEALTADKHVDLSFVSETDQPISLIIAGGPIPIDPVLEVDAVVPLTFTKTIFKDLTLVGETDLATALSSYKAYELGAVAETDTAVPLSIAIPIIMGITPITEVNSATPLSVSDFDATEGHVGTRHATGAVRFARKGYVH